MKQTKIIEEYIKKKPFYKNLTNTVAALLAVLLEDVNIGYQKIESRTKSVNSLKNKIYKKNIQNKKYKSLENITDLSGVRVIVFFKDDINKVVKLLEKEFKILKDENVDIDLNIIKKPKEFGYQSQHRIISINHNRSNIQEYKRFYNMKCEIQIRTILQHAWAEIEHDIGYKSEIKECDKDRIELTRIFSQNAALLEIADDNFVKIRKLYEKILTQYRNDIAHDKLNIPLNIDSIREYLYQHSNNKNLELQNIQASEELKNAKNKNILNLINFHKTKNNNIKK